VLWPPRGLWSHVATLTAADALSGLARRSLWLYMDSDAQGRSDNIVGGRSGRTGPTSGCEQLRAVTGRRSRTAHDIGNRPGGQRDECASRLHGAATTAAAGDRQESPRR
jgi:hypothetical protein